VVAGKEYLAQVIVAVTAEALGGDGLLHNLLEALQQTLPQREEAVRVLLDLWWQQLQLLMQGDKDSPNKTTLGLVQRALIERGKGRGRKRCGGLIGGQRQMHVRGPLAEQVGQFAALLQVCLYLWGWGGGAKLK